MRTNCVTSIFIKRVEKEEAEGLMREWVALFLQEIEKIESFYCSRFEEYCLEFDHCREMLFRKLNRKGGGGEMMEIQMT